MASCENDQTRLRIGVRFPTLYPFGYLPHAFNRGLRLSEAAACKEQTKRERQSIPFHNHLLLGIVSKVIGMTYEYRNLQRVASGAAAHDRAGRRRLQADVGQQVDHQIVNNDVDLALSFELLHRKFAIDRETGPNHLFLPLCRTAEWPPQLPADRFGNTSLVVE